MTSIEQRPVPVWVYEHDPEGLVHLASDAEGYGPMLCGLTIGGSPYLQRGAVALTVRPLCARCLRVET